MHLLIRAALILLASLAPVLAADIRVATYDVGLTRKGAGVLLADLRKEPDEQVAAILAVIRDVRPDILLLTGFDQDPAGRALDAFAELLSGGDGGIGYPYRFNWPVNAGEPSGLDLDGDGLRSGWADGWGFGRFPGNGGMAILSRHPFDERAARSFTTMRWADLPGADMPRRADGTPFPDARTAAVMRLSSRAHWDVPVLLADGRVLHLLASNPTPPLFDGAEGMNRKRNRDEIRFWTEYLSGAVFTDDQGRTEARVDAPFVLLGNLNKDPEDGAGLADAMDALLTSDRITDPRPASRGASRAAEAQGGANAGQAGPPALDTADWNDERGPGNLRVDYVLPDASLGIADAGVFWPAPGVPLAEAAGAASAHRLVWVDISLP